MAKDQVIELRKYIGRSYDQYNCFDLAKEFYRDQFGLELRNYFEGPVPDRKGVQSLIISNKGDFVEVDSPQFGDLVVIRIKGVECHIGVATGDGRFLHSAIMIGSLLDRIDRYKKVIAGYYRHRERHDSAST
jgi:cell wall-associated NlpC family hydrolase